MQSPIEVRFANRHTRGTFPGLIRVAVAEDFLAWTRWRYRPHDPDRDWDWWSIHLECSLSPDRYECYAALASNELQGLMLLDLNGQRVGSGRGITIDYLSTNPANRTHIHGLKHIGIA